jgi:hypothetical protein
MRIRAQDRSDIEATCERSIVRIEISMEDERCHRRAVAALTRWVPGLVSVRVVNN